MRRAAREEQRDLRQRPTESAKVHVKINYADRMGGGWAIAWANAGPPGGWVRDARCQVPVRMCLLVLANGQLTLCSCLLRGVA